MKKELIIYAGLIMMTCALFSFEFMVKHKKQDLTISTHDINEISTIAFDIPAKVFIIHGNESKIILEGTQLALDQLKLNSLNGHVQLHKNQTSTFIRRVHALINQNSDINLYVISENIENINVVDRDGCLVKNALFNGDRGILEVNGSDVIQFASAVEIEDKVYSRLVCLEKKTPALTSCL